MHQLMCEAHTLSIQHKRTEAVFYILLYTIILSFCVFVTHGRAFFIGTFTVVFVFFYCLKTLRFFNVQFEKFIKLNIENLKICKIEYIQCSINSSFLFIDCL